MSRQRPSGPCCVGLPLPCRRSKLSVSLPELQVGHSRRLGRPLYFCPLRSYLRSWALPRPARPAAVSHCCLQGTSTSLCTASNHRHLFCRTSGPGPRNNALLRVCLLRRFPCSRVLWTTGSDCHLVSTSTGRGRLSPNVLASSKFPCYVLLYKRIVAHIWASITRL